MQDPGKSRICPLEGAEKQRGLGSHSDFQLLLLLPGWMRQYQRRDSWGIQAGKGNCWGKGGRKESHKKGGLEAEANVMSWDKYGHWSQRDCSNSSFTTSCVALHRLLNLSELQLPHLQKEKT